MNEPIRILQVVTHMNRGGLETMLMNYYRHIDRNSVQFDFLTHREYDGDYGEEIKQLGGVIYHLPVLNPLKKTYINSLHDFFVKHPEYKVVHVHQDCLSSVILKEAENCGVPIRIAHSHIANQDHNLKFIIKMYYKRLIPKYATELFACSEEAGKWMFGRAPFNVLNNAIDARSYSFDIDKRNLLRRNMGISDSTLVVGHVGRFSPQKNHLFLLDIFFEIQKLTDARLMLVGDGELHKDIRNKIDNLKLQDKVIMTGVRSDVKDLMQTMDVFVFPSNYEGLPVTLIEAQASGLPCLISDHVPIECKKTDMVERVPLNSNAYIWANKTISMSKNKRENTFNDIKTAGFDVIENANGLERFYIKKYKLG